MILKNGASGNRLRGRGISRRSGEDGDGGKERAAAVETEAGEGARAVAAVDGHDGVRVRAVVEEVGRRLTAFCAGNLDPAFIDPSALRTPFGAGLVIDYDHVVESGCRRRRGA